MAPGANEFVFVDVGFVSGTLSSPSECKQTSSKKRERKTKKKCQIIEGYISRRQYPEHHPGHLDRPVRSPHPQPGDAWYPAFSHTWHLSVTTGSKRKRIVEPSIGGFSSTVGEVRASYSAFNRWYSANSLGSMKSPASPLSAIIVARAASRFISSYSRCIRAYSRSVSVMPSCSSCICTDEWAKIKLIRVIRGWDLRFKSCSLIDCISSSSFS